MQVAYFIALAFCLHQVDARHHPPRRSRGHGLFETEEADAFLRKILGLEVGPLSRLSFSLSFPVEVLSKSKDHSKGKAHPNSKKKLESKVKHSSAQSHRGKTKFTTTSPHQQKQATHPHSKEKPEPKVKHSATKSHLGKKKGTTSSHPPKKERKRTSLPQPTSLPALLSPVLTHPPTTTPVDFVSSPSGTPAAELIPASRDNLISPDSVTSSTGSSKNSSFIPSAGATAGFAVIGVVTVLAAALLAVHKIAQRGIPYIGLEPYVDDDDPSSLGSGMNSL